MVSENELVAIAGCAILWVAATIALVARRPRAAAMLAVVAIAATLGTLLYLRAGTGHRA